MYSRSIHKVYSSIWNKRVFATLNFLQILYFYILPFRASPMFKCPKPSADEKKPQMEDRMCCEKSMGKLLELRTLLKNVWNAIIVFTGPDFIQTYSNVRVSSSVSEVPHVVHLYICIYIYDMRPDMHIRLYMYLKIHTYVYTDMLEVAPGHVTKQLRQTHLHYQPLGQDFSGHFLATKKIL